MKLLSLKDCPPLSEPVTVYRYSPWKSFFFSAISLSLAIACLVAAQRGVGIEVVDVFPPALLYVTGAVFWILFFMGCARFRQARHPSNWVVQLTADRVLIHYRSYLNAHLPEEDPVVIDLPFPEMVWVRKTRETVMTPTSEATQIRFHTFLDIKLRLPNIDELKDALVFERNRTVPMQTLKHELFQARKQQRPEHVIRELQEKIQIEKKKHPKASHWTFGRHKHYPVTLVNPGILRVEWNGLFPGINQVIQALKAGVDVEPELKVKKNFTESGPAGNRDDQILELASQGKTMEAVTLVRQHYGFSLTEASDFVDHLLRK